MIAARDEEVIKWGQKRLKSYHILGRASTEDLKQHGRLVWKLLIDAV